MPAVPAWVFALFVLAAIIAAILLAILVWGFVSSLYRAAHPAHAGSWSRPIVLGAVVVGLAATVFVLRTDERALDDAVSEVIDISALTRSELRERSRDTDPPCRSSVLDGPTWTPGAEAKLLDTLRSDADAFERAGWDVQRFVPTDLRRDQSEFGFGGWSFRATRDHREVRGSADNDRWSRGAQYLLWAGECNLVPPIDATFARPVTTFPETPTDEVTPDEESTIRDIVTDALVRGRPAVDHELVHGLSTDRDCFVASFSTASSSSSENDDVLMRVTRELERRDGWERVADDAFVGTAVGPRPGWILETTAAYGRGAMVRLYPPACVGQLTVTAE